MKKHFILAAFATAVFALPAFALDLQGARSSAVAETASGYIKAVKSSAEVNALVTEVNAKRKAEYTRISKENGQSVEVVGQLAAPQIAKNIAAGN